MENSCQKHTRTRFSSFSFFFFLFSVFSVSGVHHKRAEVKKSLREKMKKRQEKTKQRRREKMFEETEKREKCVQVVAQCNRGGRQKCTKMKLFFCKTFLVYIANSEDCI